jgi:hypothetical protein
MKKSFLSILLLCIIYAGSAQNKKWESTDHQSYFKPSGKNEWAEFNSDGKPAFHYLVIEEKPGFIMLYDESRKMYIELTPVEMYYGNQKDSINIYSRFGTWKPQTVKPARRWEFEDKKSYFSPTGWNMEWIEFKPDGKPMFRYKEVEITPAYIILYDENRRMYVKLTDMEMFFGDSKDKTKASKFGSWVGSK